jgi:hypothetical protein
VVLTSDGGRTVVTQLRHHVRMPDEQRLTIYVSYDEYLNARQLSGLLESLDSLYDILRYASSPQLRGLLPRPANTELRIAAVATGNSITIQVVEGVTQLVQSMDPALAGTIAGAPAVVALGALMYRILDKSEQLIHRTMTNKIERESSRTELAASRAELEHRKQELARHEFVVALHDAAALMQGQVPAVTPTDNHSSSYSAMSTEAMPALEQFLRVVEATNIRHVRITRDGL